MAAMRSRFDLGRVLKWQLCEIVLLGSKVAYSVGSACTNGFGPWGSDRCQNDGGFMGNPLGGVVVIPLRAIACFTHHAI